MDRLLQHSQIFLQKVGSSALHKAASPMMEDITLFTLLMSRMKTSTIFRLDPRPYTFGAHTIVEWYEDCYNEEFVASVLLFRKIAEDTTNHDEVARDLKEIAKHVNFDVVRALGDAIFSSSAAEEAMAAMRERGLP